MNIKCCTSNFKVRSTHVSSHFSLIDSTFKNKLIITLHAQAQFIRFIVWNHLKISTVLLGFCVAFVKMLCFFLYGQDLSVFGEASQFKRFSFCFC